MKTPLELGSDTQHASRWLALALAVLYVAVWWKVRHTLGWSFRGGDDLGWVADVEHRNTLRTFFDPFLVTKNEGPSTYYIPLQSVLY